LRGATYSAWCCWRRRPITRESYHFLTKLAQASGIETPTRADLARTDRRRKNKGSNDDWTHPHDPDAKITKMKDGRTHFAHKAEHSVATVRMTDENHRAALRGQRRIFRSYEDLLRPSKDGLASRFDERRCHAEPMPNAILLVLLEFLQDISGLSAREVALSEVLPDCGLVVRKRPTRLDRVFAQDGIRVSVSFTPASAPATVQASTTNDISRGIVWYKVHLEVHERSEESQLL